MREEIAQLPDQGVRLTRNDKFEILAEHQQNPVFLEYVRQHHQDEDQQRDEREQGVIRHRPREQQTLVGAKLLDHGQRERARMLEHLPGIAAQAARSGYHLSILPLREARPGFHSANDASLLGGNACRRLVFRASAHRSPDEF